MSCRYQLEVARHLRSLVSCMYPKRTPANCTTRVPNISHDHADILFTKNSQFGNFSHDLIAEFCTEYMQLQCNVFCRIVCRNLQNPVCVSSLMTPTPHFIDNRSAIIIAENKAPTKGRKCIDLRHHYLQNHVEKRDTTLLVRKCIPQSSTGEGAWNSLGSSQQTVSEMQAGELKFTRRRKNSSKLFLAVYLRPCLFVHDRCGLDKGARWAGREAV